MIKCEIPLKKNSLKDINLPLFVYLRSQNKNIQKGYKIQSYDKYTYLLTVYICFDGVWSTLLYYR